MTDRSWLGFGGRVRAPQPANHDNQSDNVDHAPPALHRSLTQVYVQQQQHQQHHKPPKLSRISSYIGLGAAAKSHSPTTPTYPEITMDRSESMNSGNLGLDLEGPHKKNENNNFYNEADSTWHNPSLKQMIETVSCEMMRNGSSAPIPRHLNGWIASIIEEISHQFCELRDLRAQFADLKETRQKELKEFSAMTSEWEQREYGFKAEINRLEHIISDTQQGAKSVLLARAGSVVNRDDGAAFRAKMDRLSRSEDEDVTLDRNHDYLVEYAKRNSIALSTGGAGLSVDTSPYKTLGTAPRFLDPSTDVYLSQQLRNAVSRRRPRRDQDLDARMAAARISVALTGKPPAPSVKGKASARNSNSSSSSSSSGKASSGSSLLTQGLLAEKMAHDQVTPHTSPTKDEILYGRPVKGPAKGCDILETIREMAAQNGGLPDDAVDDESSYASTPRFSRHQRAFSFNAGEEGFGAPRCLPKTLSSQRPQQSTAEERPSSSQLDGLTQERGDFTPTNLNNQTTECFDTSSDEESNHSRSSILMAMGRNRVTDAGKDETTTAKGRDLDEPSALVQMTKAMAFRRDAVANNLREQARSYMPGPTAPSAVKGLPPDGGCGHDAASEGTISGHKGQLESQAQAV
ncbi:hypothetical protein VM1G_06656 [Cytospora mali]|uniref:Uncharacterized protein n=1 Tax=Cytospora mali TaxID=578113 RepID=A0A194W5W0_CYTMA|nr:hypothetical protein VM1G_06656 [Valsa mali]